MARKTSMMVAERTAACFKGVVRTLVPPGLQYCVIQPLVPAVAR
jgi:hypothetical protein